MRYLFRRRLLPLACLFTALIITGCGGGGGGGGGLLSGGGIGGTGITTSGTITGFGSVFVNGIEFETGGSSFDVDDDSAAVEDDLGIGMVVTVTGTLNDDGVTGSADSIIYDDEVEGPIAAAPVEDADGLNKTFSIFDITVIANRNTTVYVGTDYASLDADDIVEVSGYFDASGKLIATRIEKEGVLGAGTVVELKGTVSDFNGIDTFLLGTITVTFDGTTDLSELPGGVIANGQYVEVKGTLQNPTTVLATRIELEDEGFGDDVDKVSIEGLVSEFSGLADFRVGGQPVDASAAVFIPASLANTLGNGDKVEVEGPINGGLLEAVEVEQRGGEIRIDAVVTVRNVASGTVTLEVVSGQPVLTVSTDTQTQFEDDRDEVEPFGLVDIAAGDFLAIEAYLDGSGEPVATQIERQEQEDIELRGPADVPPTGGTTSSGTVSILGVSIVTDDSTQFENASEQPISGGSFYGLVADGDLVRFTDEEPDGTAEEVEFED